MTFTQDGLLLASGAVDGSVIVYDYSRRRVIASMNAHDGLVTNLVWRGRELWTASLDGSVKQWILRNDDITLTKTSKESAVRFFHLLATGWTANVGDHILLLNSHDRTLRFDMGRHVERVEVSPDERYLAATMDGETVILDLVHASVTSLRIPSDGVGYVGFPTDDTLIISNGSVLLRLPLSTLDYIAY
jgi:WD40 repeat protein